MSAAAKPGPLTHVATFDMPPSFPIYPDRLGDLVRLFRENPPSAPFQIWVDGKVAFSGVIGPAEPAAR